MAEDLVLSAPKKLSMCEHMQQSVKQLVAINCQLLQSLFITHLRLTKDQVHLKKHVSLKMLTTCSGNSNAT